MQKKLIALAIAGLSSAAFAQSTVTVSGLMDLGYSNARTEAAGVKTTTANWGVANGSATSHVAFTATEALGSGMTAKVYIETDPAFGTTTGSAFANAPNWLQLSGGFGSVTMGYINNFALTTSSTSQPFGTATGSAYSGSFGRLDGATALGTPAAAALGGAGARDVRADNTFEYKSPSFGGFTAGLQHKVKNTDAGALAANQVGQAQIGLNYNNGPINVSYTNSQISGAAGAAGALANAKVTHNMLGGNYTFGPATIYAGWTSSKSSTAATIDSRSWNLAAKFAFAGNWAGMINVVKVDDKLIGNQDRSLTGLGLDYAMSKRTTAYVRYENGDNDKAAGNAGAFTRWNLGARHSF